MLESRMTFRVRYQETDRMENVYHANYLVWFEMGRTEFMREQGISYRQMEEESYGLVVVEASASYHAPARYDDLVTVRTTLPAHNRAALKFEYAVHLGKDEDGPLLCGGSTVLVFIDRARRPRRFPPHYLEIISRASGGKRLKRKNGQAQGTE